MPTNAECEDNRKEIYDKLHGDREKLAEISGGIKALKWFLPIVIGLICTLLGAYTTLRFNAIQLSQNV